MSSKKTVLKVTPNVPASSQQKVKRKNDYLRECINTIIKRELLHLNVKKVFDILVNDLHINLRNVTPRMKYVLSECLCYYMKMWPGWQKYDSVCTNERAKVEYIERFKEYLVFKIKYIIENERIFNPDAQSQQPSNMVSQEVQTDPITKKNKPEAPYNLVISGQPNVLNNIVFIEAGNDIIVKQHAEKIWKPLNVAEFLNYSFVHVSIKLPDLELSRSNVHEFQRYVTKCGDTAYSPNIDFITYIKRKTLTTKPKVYTMDYIHAYCVQFVETLKTVPGINPVKITELEEAFRQFILDIKETSVFTCTNSSGSTVSTMATETSVCFNIGRKTYIRNKKMVTSKDQNQKETNLITFCEVLIPRMAYTLNKFSVEEDVTTEETSFKSLNAIKAQVENNIQELYKFVEAVNSSVTYHCLLCPKVYSGDRAYIDILDHFRFLHKGEQSVLCFSCREQFTVAKLAGNRWTHNCKKESETNSDRVKIAASNALVSVETKAPIGINDILASTGSSTISVNDLLNTQNVKVVAPVNSCSSEVTTIGNVVSNILPTTTIINTLPIVRVPTTNVMPASNVTLPYQTIFAITPSSLSSSNTLSSTSVTVSSIFINSNPSNITTVSSNRILPTNIISSCPVAPVPSTTYTAISANVNMTSNITDEIDTIKTEVDVENEKIVDISDIKEIPLELETNMVSDINASMSNASLVNSGLHTTPVTPVILTPIVASPLNSTPVNIMPLANSGLTISSVLRPENAVHTVAAPVNGMPIMSLPVATTLTTTILSNI